MLRKLGWAITDVMNVSRADKHEVEIEAYKFQPSTVMLTHLPIERVAEYLTAERVTVNSLNEVLLRRPHSCLGGERLAS
jgi:hypothetical protein